MSVTTFFLTVSAAIIIFLIEELTRACYALRKAKQLLAQAISERNKARAEALPPSVEWKQ